MNVSQKVSQLLSRHISQLNFSKGHDSVKIVGEVTILVLCTLPDGALYLFKTCLKRFKSYYTDTVFLLKFLEGHNSIRYVGGVKALLCTSPDYALYMYLYQF